MNERCTWYQDRLGSEPLNELSAQDLVEVEQHLEGCADCSHLRDGLNEDDRRLDRLVAESESRLGLLESRITEQLDDMRIEEPVHEVPASSAFFSRTWVRLALAASIAVVAFLGVNLVKQDNFEGLVWADVIARVENAQDFICRRIEKRAGEPAQEMVEYRSAVYGLRQDIYQNDRRVAEQYIVPGEKMLYALIHRDRTYMRQSMSTEQIKVLEEQGNARAIVESFKEYDYENLGRKKIDGRWAEGIEVRDPQEWKALFEEGVWRLWVDLETQWPVLIQLEGKARQGQVRKTYTLKDFQWNPELTARDFAFEIPDNYRLIADMAENKADEEHTIAALRAYAKLVGGRYPSALTLTTAIAEAEKELDRRHSGYTEAAGKDIQALFLIRNACDFFQKLEKEGKEPRYHGDAVTGKDFDEVLMSWQAEEGWVRVITGDLRVETRDQE